MPELQDRRRTGDESTGSDRPERGDAGATFELAGADVAVSGDPTEPEAAALAAAVAEHLRTEGESELGEESRYAVDPWCLAGRLGLRSSCELPLACRSGREWKVAGRAATR